MAKSLQQSLDKSKTDTTVPTATLDLLLTTFIAVAQDGNPISQKIEAAQAAFLASRLNGSEGGRT